MCGSMLQHLKPGRYLPFAHPRLDAYRKFLERPRSRLPWGCVHTSSGRALCYSPNWDDFFRTLDHPFRPLPYLVDDFNATMNRLIPLAERAGVEVLIPTPWQTTNPLALPR